VGPAALWLVAKPPTTVRAETIFLRFELTSEVESSARSSLQRGHVRSNAAGKRLNSASGCVDCAGDLLDCPAYGGMGIPDRLGVLERNRALVISVHSPGPDV